MPRCIDDIDAVFVELLIHPTPEAGCSGRRNGDASFLLLRHPVHSCRAVMNLANLVGDSRVVENTLGRRRLSGVDMRHDSDVSVAFDGGLAGHREIPIGHQSI